jgi:malonyl-CoA decarboxylase
LRRELPGLQTFITLSPVPGLAIWLAQERARKDSLLTPGERKALEALDNPDWHLRTDRPAELKEVLIALTARYIVQTRSKTGGVIDPVARFHLGNGARLEQICFLADITPKGLRTAHGMMVSYLYDLRYIERNHESFSERNQVPASATMIRLARPRGLGQLEKRHQDAVQSDAAPTRR